MTGEPLVIRTTDLDAQVLNPEVILGHGVLLIPHGVNYTPIAPPSSHPVQDDVERLLTLHRRVQNTRSCTGCDWTPSPVGRNGDPETMGRRSRQFNAHLARLIVAALPGC